MKHWVITIIFHYMNNYKHVWCAWKMFMTKIFKIKLSPRTKRDCYLWCMSRLHLGVTLKVCSLNIFSHFFRVFLNILVARKHQRTLKNEFDDDRLSSRLSILQFSDKVKRWNLVDLTFAILRHLWKV